MRDLAVALGLPLLIAAAPGLGTINHTLLTLEAARAAGLDVRAVVLTPWPEQPSELERSNRETIARLGEVEVARSRRAAEPRRSRDLGARGRPRCRGGAWLRWASRLGGSRETSPALERTSSRRRGRHASPRSTCARSSSSITYGGIV